MELCDGDLHTLIKSRREGFTKHEAKHFIAQMAEGMRVLKAEGIVHRDLKPSNILYRTDAQAQRYVYQIADFGFAKFSEEEFRGDTRDGEMNSIPVGTICFMAPEAMNIHEQRSQSNKKVDLWSFGALLYYCLTKEVGFKVPALIEKDFNRLMQYLKDKDDALGMKIDVKINASSDSEDMLDINVDYDRFRQLPLSVQDRLSKEFAAKLTWFMKKLLVFEPETRMSFEDFFQYAEDFSSNHYMLCDGLSGEAEPFVPAKYSR
jgi:serine/threonine protein kinase